MKINLEFKVLPFNVPTSVSLVGSESLEYAYNLSMPVPPPPFPAEVINHIKLSSLTSEALETLCEEFTRGVFKEAGKSRPVQPRQRLHLEDGPVYQELQRDLKTCINLINKQLFSDAVKILRKWEDGK